jgi:hypothetical protein
VSPSLLGDPAKKFESVEFEGPEHLIGNMFGPDEGDSVCGRVGDSGDSN